MKRIFYLFTLLTIVFALNPLPQLVAKASEAPEENSGAVLCTPGIYLQTPDDCVPLGPSQYLTENARLGMEFPIRPLQISHPDLALGDLPYQYYKITNPNGTGIYPSLEAAISKSGGQPIPPGFVYLAYSQRIDEHNFLLPSGTYIPGDGETMASNFNEPYKFPGVEVHATPRNAFGFAIQPTDVRHEPNFLPYNAPIRQLKRYEVVQVYSTQRIEGYDWCLIGPDEWALGRDIAVVTPNTTPPDGVTDGRWIDVDLAEQTLAVYDNGEMVYATVVATGAKPTYTRPGLFHIYKKLETETMQGGVGTSEFYHLEDVPWTMYFDNARALHGAYWRANLGIPQSHGCVNLFPGDAHWLFNWAKEGDWVYAHDPTGETPTDPALYGDGAGS
jgi:hypothetical protein